MIRYCKGCKLDKDFWNVNNSTILCIDCEKKKYRDSKVSVYSLEEKNKAIVWLNEMIDIDTKLLTMSKLLLYTLEMCQVYCVLSEDSRELDGFSIKKQIKEQHRWLSNYKKKLEECTDVETPKK